MADSTQTLRCIECERTSDAVPLVQVQYKGKGVWICTEHLPIMIHSPAKLAYKLPGLENVEGHQS
jgi:hypothetical protein